MKKIMLIAIIFALFLVSCFQNSRIQEKKQDALVNSKQLPYFKKQSKNKKIVPALQGCTPTKVKVIKIDNAKESSDEVFINSTEGWKAKYSDPAMYRQSASLYKTIDGGKTWKRINSSKNSLPLETKTGITFLNNRTGWITTDAPKDGHIGLYRTLDGGFTWRLQKLKVPQNYRKCEFNVFPPVFFSRNNGILLTRQNGLEQLVYITKDGGRTWSKLTEKATLNNVKWSFNTRNNVSTWLITYHGATWKSLDGYIWSDNN